MRSSPAAARASGWEARIVKGKAERGDVEKHILIGRFPTANEIAAAIVWLASDKGAYVVGHTLVMDGGLSLT